MGDAGTRERAALDAPPLHAVGFRLSWGDCDPAGIVYYATYLHWAERVHTEWWYLNGVHPGALEPGGDTTFVVRHVECDYLRPPRVLDELSCTLSLAGIGTTSSTTAFTFDAVGSAATQARLRLTCVVLGQDGRPAPVPERMRQLLAGATAADGEVGR